MELYQEAAAVLEKFQNKQGSVKNLVFATNYKNIRQLYALVCESLKFQQVLSTIFERCESLQGEEPLQAQPNLATVLLYDHLVGKGLGRAGKIRSCILKHKRELQAVCDAVLEERGAAAIADLLSPQCQAMNKLKIPRYARVNLLKTTLDDVVNTFTSEGWVWAGSLPLENFTEGVVSLGKEKFGLDPLLTDLLIFPPGTELHEHPLTLSGKIMLQDRASCFPAHVLDPARGSTVLDCCAAPGNKTSHAASLMGNSGKILAYERDGKRVSLLKQQLGRLGVKNTATRHQDFLSVDQNDPEFADVQYILVDPSCTGSGIINRMDHISNQDTGNQKTESAERLPSLQRFQISILKHALSFPSAERVVYSTCSVYEEENEAVVTEVAEQFRGRFKVKDIFPEFPHRGKGNSAIVKCCLRMSPKKDATNGFFVACFERIRDDDEEEEGGENEEEEKNEGGGEEEKDEEEEEMDSRSDNRGITTDHWLRETNFGETKKKKKKKRKCKDSEEVSVTTIDDAEGELEKSKMKKKKKKNKRKKSELGFSGEKELGVLIPETDDSVEEEKQQLERSRKDSMSDEKNCVKDSMPEKKNKKRKHKLAEHQTSETVNSDRKEQTELSDGCSGPSVKKKKKKSKSCLEDAGNAERDVKEFCEKQKSKTGLVVEAKNNCEHDADVPVKKRKEHKKKHRSHESHTGNADTDLQQECAEVESESSSVKKKHKKKRTQKEK